MEILDNECKLDIIYFVKKGESLASVADKFCVNMKSIIRDNNLSQSEEIEEGDILWIKKKNTCCHIVKPAESLTSIAQKYGVSVEHIKSLNEIENIFIGQKIFI